MGKKNGYNIPPKVTEKMSLMYLESFRKMLEKTLFSEPEKTVYELYVDVCKILSEKGFKYTEEYLNDFGSFGTSEKLD